MERLDYINKLYETGEYNGPRYFGELRSIDVKSVARISYFYTRCKTAEKILNYIEGENT